MKKVIFALILLSCICIPAFADTTDEDNSEDMFQEYIHENSSIDDSKSTELYENQYVFEYYPYVSMRYTSRTLKDEDIVRQTKDKSHF